MSLDNPSLAPAVRIDLNERRPDRYTHGDTKQTCACGIAVTWANDQWLSQSTGDPHICWAALDPPTALWLDVLADEYAPLIESTAARVKVARAMIGHMEAGQTRITLRIVRECPQRPPLDWAFFRTLPLVVGRERVAIRATSAADWRQFAEEEELRLQRDHQVRMQTVAAAIWIADFMDARGLRTGAAIQW